MFALPVGMGFSADTNRDTDNEADEDPHSPLFDVVGSLFDKSGKDKAGPLPPKIPVEVKQSSHKFQFIFDLPSVDAADVKVQVLNSSMLCVTAQRPVEKHHLFRKDEVVKETLARSFLLPREAKLEDATAKFGNGVLAVTVPRVPKAAVDAPQVVDILVEEGALCKGEGSLCPCCCAPSSTSLRDSSADVIEVPSKMGS